MSSKKRLKETSQPAKKPRVTGTFWLLVVLSLLATIILAEKFILPRQEQEAQQINNPKTQTVPLRVGSAQVQVEIRNDDSGRSLGLSGRSGLGINEGMLFVFEQPQQPIFWMKDMQFALDVIWIAEGKVLQIDERVQPPTEQSPQVETMTPTADIEAVLEVAAGWAQQQGIAVGDEVEIILP